MPVKTDDDFVDPAGMAEIAWTPEVAPSLESAVLQNLVAPLSSHLAGIEVEADFNQRWPDVQFVVTSGRIYPKEPCGRDSSRPFLSASGCR